MTEAQRKRTLKDGQEAGEMLLDIEGRIGELLEKKTPGLKTSLPGGGRQKADYDEIDHRRAGRAIEISKHPEIVERVKAQARENELFKNPWLGV